MSIRPNRFLDMELAVMAAERLVLVGFEHRHFEALREMLTGLKEQSARAARIEDEAHDEITLAFGSLCQGLERQVSALRRKMMISEGGDDWDTSELADGDIAVKQFETAMENEIDDAENALKKFFAQ